MKLFTSITAKLAIWWLCVIFVFNGTLIVLYFNIRQMMTISTHIVEQQNKISTTSKKMIETLLYMEEMSKKYALLQKESYIEQFDQNKQIYFNDLVTVMALSRGDTEKPSDWDSIYAQFLPYNVPRAKNITMDELGLFWIPEKTLTAWTHAISDLRQENDQRIEASNLELHRRGEWALKSGLIAVAVCALLATLSILFLSRAIIGPIKTLLKGFQTLSSQQPQRLIEYRKEDEFGKLADAFNALARRLQREEEMRSDFIDMLSHEIRTPLTSISESVNLIEEGLMGPVNERQRKFLTIAANEIDRVVDLLNHLLEVSSLEKEGMDLELAPIDPQAFIEGCIAVMAPLAMAKKIDIEALVPPDMPSVPADPEKLRQVMSNLLGNAIKFSPQKAMVKVFAGVYNDQKTFRFSVSDTGPGIKTSETALIFDKYYRGTDMKSHMDGAGLGLHISKHIIEAHDGRLWVESQIGQGSTFSVDLPLKIEES